MSVTLIKKKTLKLNTLEKGMISVLVKQGKINEKKLNEPTKTWNTVEPNIKSELDKKNYSILTAPLDDDDGKKYSWLDGGTSVRYAQLSKNWQSKTTPNSFLSGQGSGFVTHIDTNRPQPGIEARNWSELTAEEELPKFEKNVSVALNKGLNKLY